MTNYEKIKNMSVVEMAEMLHGVCPYTLKPILQERKRHIREICKAKISCFDCRVKYLESEAEE